MFKVDVLSLSCMHVTAFSTDQRLCRWCSVMLLRLPMSQWGAASSRCWRGRLSCARVPASILKFSSQSLCPFSSYRLLIRTLSPLLNTIIYGRWMTSLFLTFSVQWLCSLVVSRVATISSCCNVASIMLLTHVTIQFNLIFTSIKKVCFHTALVCC